MGPLLWIVAGVIIFLIVLCYFWYAGLIGKRNKALQALSGIDVQLRKRFDLIPNVLKIAGRFMQHEKELLTGLTDLRTKAMSNYDAGDPKSVKEHLEAVGAIQPAMMRIFAVAENYPELKTSETMITAQHTYTEVEGHLSAARRSYNAAAERLNTSAQVFPGNLIAAMAGVSPMPFYEETD